MKAKTTRSPSKRAFRVKSEKSRYKPLEWSTKVYGGPSKTRPYERAESIGSCGDLEVFRVYWNHTSSDAYTLYFRGISKPGSKLFEFETFASQEEAQKRAQEKWETYLDSVFLK